MAAELLCLFVLVLVAGCRLRSPTLCADDWTLVHHHHYYHHHQAIPVLIGGIAGVQTQSRKAAAAANFCAQ